MSYPEFIEKNIFSPIGMSHTFVFMPEIMPNKNFAYSYLPSKTKGLKRVTNYYNADKPKKNIILWDGDKHIYSTTEDMLKLDQALYTEKLISQKSIEEAFTRYALNDGKNSNYGLGWSIGLGSDSTSVYHSGFIENYSSLFVRYPETKKTIVILQNDHSKQLWHTFYNVNCILKDKKIRKKRPTAREKRTYISFKKKVWIDYSKPSL